MALSEDQKAMLRLLAQREQGYEDLAALMGLSVGEVREKVKDALDQLEADGGTPPPLPPEPEPPAQAPEPAPAPPPEMPEPTAAAAEPGEPTPANQPGEPAAPAAKPPPPSPSPPGSRPRPSLPSGKGARAALGAGLLVLIALVVVLAVSGGDDSGGPANGAGEGAATEEAVAANGKDVTQAVLEPVDGSDASGLAVFGRIKNSLALQVEASGLAPTAKGESYTIWLYDSPQKMLPLASTAVSQSGRFAARVEVPTEVLGYLADESFDQVDVSLTSDATLKASLAKATSEKKAPVYTGTDVLRGQITGPIIGAAKRQQGK